MRVCQLRIKGFRGTKDACIHLNPHTVIVGPNNCGKTTIVEALALIFGRDRMVRKLTEHDFFGSEPTATSRIMLIATVTDFEHNDPQRYPTWFGAARGGAEKWFDAKTRTLHATRNLADWKLAVQIGFAARFDLEDLETESMRFFVDDEDSIGDPFADDSHNVVLVPSAVLQELGFFLVPASRTWDKLISFSSELFRRVVSTLGGVPARSIRSERERLWKPAAGERLEEQDGLREIVTSTNAELAHLISSVPELELRITSTDSSSVLEAVVPHYRHGTGPCLPTSRHGTGLVSLQSLLLLMQFGRARAEQNKSFVLAVEEPELHIQPSQQRRLVNRINALCDQTVITTHSPLVAAMFSPENILFAENADGVLMTKPLTKVMPAQPTNHVQHLLFAWRQRLIGALMHDRVLIPEGPSDVAWLEALQNALELDQDWSNSEEDSMQFSTFVGVVPTHDAKILETLEVVNGVHSGPAVLLDGDDEGDRYLEQVKASAKPPGIAVLWPEDWTIENVIGWIAKSDEAAALIAIGSALGQSFANIEALVDHLLAKKSYAPTPEAVTAALVRNDKCRVRAGEVMGALADVLVGRTTPASGVRFEHLADKSSASTRVFRLKHDA